MIKLKCQTSNAYRSVQLSLDTRLLNYLPFYLSWLRFPPECRTMMDMSPCRRGRSWWWSRWRPPSRSRRLWYRYRDFLAPELNIKFMSPQFSSDLVLVLSKAHRVLLLGARGPWWRSRDKARSPGSEHHESGKLSRLSLEFPKFKRNTYLLTLFDFPLIKFWEKV